jgi:hypothetical protein
MKSIQMITATSTILVFAGCASVPKASSQYQQTALSFAPTPGKAGVYVIRPSSPIAAGLLYRVSIDYAHCGTLASGSYIYAELDPGDHMLQAAVVRHFAGEATPFKFTAELSKLYFLQTALGFGHMSLEPVEEIKGKQLVRKYKLSGDSNFEAQPRK